MSKNIPTLIIHRTYDDHEKFRLISSTGLNSGEYFTHAKELNLESAELISKCVNSHAQLVEALKEAKRMFYLMLVDPIEKPVSAFEFESLWERDKQDARNAIKNIETALKSAGVE